MKTKIILKLGFAIIFIVNVSCVEWVTSTENNQEHGYEIEYSEPLGLPAIDIEYCGDAKLMELWYNTPVWGVYGTAVVYNDGEKLFVQLDVLQDSVNAGWYIAETYLFIGEDWLWFNNNTAREPDWTTDSFGVIQRSVQDGYPTKIILDTTISELELDCFYLAVKTRMEHQDTDAKFYPRGYINESGIFLATIWGRQLCLETCTTP